MFGGTTPRQNANAITGLSLIAAVVSIVVGVLMYLTRFNEPLILYLAAAILVCNAGWHLSNFAVGLKLRKKLSGGSSQKTDSQTALPPAATTELLEVGTPPAPLPLSIVEDTTKDLKDKLRR